VAPLSPAQLAFLIVAGLVSGAVNAVAGGGSLLVFPALLAAGLPALDAVTNSVSQWPGYVGVTAGARRELVGQRHRVVATAAVAVPGAAVGCGLLLVLPRSVFNAVVPWLVLLATVVFALSRRFKRRIGNPEQETDGNGAPVRDPHAVLLPSIFVASSRRSMAVTSAAPSR